MGFEFKHIPTVEVLFFISYDLFLFRDLDKLFILQTSAQISVTN